MKKLTQTLLGAAALSCFAAAADATSIAIDWGATANGGSPAMTASETAGVVSQANWNSFVGSAQAAPQSLRDDGGVTTTATVTWDSPGNWTVLGANTGVNDAHMMNGYLDHTNDDTTLGVTVNNIPYPLYDVIVYHESAGGDNRPGSYQIGGTTLFTKDQAGNFNGTYVQDQHPDSAAAIAGSGGNYVRFAGLTDANFTLTATALTGPGFGGPGGLRAPIQGMQIVLVPEPAAAGLAAIAGAGLLAVRRRRV